jgi:vitamin B12 transporter
VLVSARLLTQLNGKQAAVFVATTCAAPATVSQTTRRKFLLPRQSLRTSPLKANSAFGKVAQGRSDSPDTGQPVAFRSLFQVHKRQFRKRLRGCGSRAITFHHLESLVMFHRYPAPRASIYSPFLLLTTLTATSAWAQQPTLAPVVITATREPQSLDRVTSDVQVISQAQIRASSADSVEDLLRREAGLQMSRTGGPGQSASVLIRGASAANTVVLIDGVRAGSATLGQFEFESISLGAIERIEVLRGPGSSLYGADAVGGVVQIFTKRGQTGAPLVSAHVALGQYRSGVADVAVSGAQAGFDYAASLGHERSRGVSSLKAGADGYNPDGDGYNRSTGQFKLGYTPATGHRVGLNALETRVNAQFDSNEYLADGSSVSNTDVRSKLKTRVAALDYRGVISPLWTLTAQLARNEDDLYSGATKVDHYRTLRHQFLWQNALKLDADQQLVLAYEHLRDQAQTSAYLRDESRRNNAAVLGYTGQWQQFGVQFDARHDRNSVYGPSTTGRLGASWNVTPEWRLRALGGTSFRAPNYNELYYPGYGVTSITPERGRSVELGVNWRGAQGGEAALTVYRNRVTNLIGYESNASQCPVDLAYQYGCARNIGRAQLQGATLSGAHQIGAWRVSATLDALDAKDLDTNKRLTRRAAHQETAALDYQGGHWSLGAALLAVGSRPDVGNTELGSYETLDLRGHWQLAKQWRLEAKLVNATNRRYEPADNYQALGRQAWVGVRFDE